MGVFWEGFWRVVGSVFRRCLGVISHMQFHTKPVKSYYFVYSSFCLSGDDRIHFQHMLSNMRGWKDGEYEIQLLIMYCFVVKSS